MLEYLRNAADKPVAKVLIAILAFSFVGWGVAEWVFGGSRGDSTLVHVGNADVTMQQFNVEKSRQMAQMTREQQRAVYTDAQTGAAFTARVLGDLSTQRMAENRANDLGFVVTDARIAREIREFPEFQQNGKFSAYLFDAVLANSGYTEAQFADVLRNQVLRGYALGALSVPMNVPNFVVDATYNARYGQKKIEYATVRFSDFKVGKPTDAELQEYYAAHPQIVPEHRTVSYVLIPADMSKPDSYDVAYATAQKVEDDIIAGESMSAAAKRHGAKFVSLDAFPAAKRPVDAILTDTMVAKIFDMEAGLESELTETKQGFVIVRVDKITPQHNAEFASVKKNLVADWTRDAARKQAYIRANEILVDLNQNGKFADKKAAAKSATVSRTSGAPTDILVAAFNSGANANSIVSGDDAFYVLRVGEFVAPQVDSKKMADLRKELQNMSAREITDDYNSFLIRTYPVKINHKVYDRFFAK